MVGSVRCCWIRKAIPGGLRWPHLVVNAVGEGIPKYNLFKFPLRVPLHPIVVVGVVVVVVVVGVVVVIVVVVVVVIVVVFF